MLLPAQLGLCNRAHVLSIQRAPMGPKGLGLLGVSHNCGASYISLCGHGRGMCTAERALHPASLMVGSVAAWIRPRSHRASRVRVLRSQATSISTTSTFSTAAICTAVGVGLFSKAASGRTSRAVSGQSDHLVSEAVVGVDEAGRGSLAGPVVAAAVFAPTDVQRDVLGACVIRDSKKMTERQRQAAYEKLVSTSGLRYGVGLIQPRRIDEINILQATFEAMSFAVDELLTSEHANDDKVLQLASAGNPHRVWVDGHRVPPQLKQRDSLDCQCIVRGDDSVFSIAAASIIAKVTRDHIMRDLASQHPLYGFERHKGYGTVAHRKALLQHGPSSVHRLSFHGCEPSGGTRAARGIHARAEAAEIEFKPSCKVGLGGQAGKHVPVLGSGECGVRGFA